MSFLKMSIIVLLLGTQSAGAEPPDWFVKSLQRLAPDTSIWVADNSAYRSANEQIDDYVMEWRWGLGKQSAVGRLYGRVDGEEVGTYWEFRMYWHPEEEAAYLQQFGVDGTFGTGKMEPDGEHSDRLTQTFYGANGSTMRVGHKTEHSADSNTGTSFDILPDGSWQERRTYTWHREETAK